MGFFKEKFVDPAVANVKGKANQIYGKGKQKFNSFLDTRPGGAESAGFLRGDLVESVYDSTIGAIALNTKERAQELIGEAGRGFENVGLQAKKALATPITDPLALTGNLVKTPVTLINETASMIAKTVGSTVKFMHTGYEGFIGRPVDRIATQIREKIGYIPLIGGILGKTMSGSLNVANRLMSTPFQVAEWTREKLGQVSDKYIFDPIRGATMNEAAAPA